ncbi:MAG: pantoate--beta-alanine ligase [Omnitrophica bacterium]|nr:pantoate--beta-alanine ligase [Candidatus Omnitrophota bacterium]
MLTTKKVNIVKGAVNKEKAKAKTVGFVPTMGALHKGHLSLVRKARLECDFLVVSIFINPLQFGRSEDYKKYPRNLNQDEYLLEKEKVNLLFWAQADKMYPADFSVYVEEVNLSKVLCGYSRPGHFKGVCTILTKLFNIVNPDIAYFGQKDYQQALIVKKIVRDLNFPIKIEILPTVRENDGLAISSRNSCLSLRQRRSSSCLYRALSLAKKTIKGGERNSKNILDKMRQEIKNNDLTKIDYIKILDAYSLKELTTLRGKVVVALAVYIGRTRLIDNIILNVG